MNNIISLVFTFSINVCYLYGQFEVDFKRDWEWRVGESCIGADTTNPNNGRGNTIIRFSNGGTPNAQYYCPVDRNLGLNFDFTVAEICDTAGNLILTSNGNFIGNEEGDTLVGGGIMLDDFVFYNGRRNPQGALFLPIPNSLERYMFFNLPMKRLPSIFPMIDQLYVSEIDMALNQGEGLVTIRNHSVLTDSTLTGRITACRHANGRDWWVVVARADISRLHKFILQPDGLHYTGYQDISGFGLFTGGYGATCFSPDGTKLVRTEAVYSLDTIGGLYVSLYDFNRCTGIFSNPELLHLPGPCTIGGSCFSPSSELLYFTFDSVLLQIDITTTTPFTRIDTIWQWDGDFDVWAGWATIPALLHLGADNRIYVLHGGLKDYHIIPNPNIRGIGCGFIPRGLITPSWRTYQIPNYPHFRLGREEGSPCDTVYSSVAEIDEKGIKIYPNPASNVLNIEWDEETNPMEVVIYNVLGQEVFRTKKSQLGRIMTINTEKFSNGIYLVVFDFGNGKRGSKKLIVQK